MSDFTLTPEIATALREAIAARVRFWDKAYALEQLVCAEVGDDAFAIPASECRTPEDAFDFGDDQLRECLDGQLKFCPLGLDTPT